MTTTDAGSSILLTDSYRVVMAAPNAVYMTPTVAVPAKIAIQAPRTSNAIHTSASVSIPASAVSVSVRAAK